MEVKGKNPIIKPARNWTPVVQPAAQSFILTEEPQLHSEHLYLQIWSLTILTSACMVKVKVCIHIQWEEPCEKIYLLNWHTHTHTHTHTHDYIYKETYTCPGAHTHTHLHTYRTRTILFPCMLLIYQINILKKCELQHQEAEKSWWSFLNKIY
jgi:hypothetical protein